jgi:hypothetical protein
MRSGLVCLLVLFAGVARAAEAPPKATWTVEGKTHELAKESLKEGVPAVFGFLGSCSAETVPGGGKDYTKDDLKMARAGDHFRLVFGKAQTVEVMNKPVEVEELVVSSGAIWVRSGNKVRRFAKYDFKKGQAFEAWLRNAARVQ